jgi:ABC-2 type transport system permease protein
MNSRSLFWSVRREVWENRSIYLAPLAVAVVIVFGAFAGTIAQLSGVKFDKLPPHKITAPYEFAAGALMGTTLIVAIFYCLDALYGERRDRSILFWKSMPVSDLTAVLSKMAVPLIILPLVTFAITIATQFIMLLMGSATLLVNGREVGALWSRLSWGHMSVMLFYHLVTVHSLYYAPIFGWLLLVSAWAKRLPFLWAFLPLAAVGVLERIVFGTSRFGRLLASRIGGGMKSDGTMLGSFAPLEFLSSPGLWIGLALAGACVAGAVRLRHNREPI